MRTSGPDRTDLPATGARPDSVPFWAAFRPDTASAEARRADGAAAPPRSRRRFLRWLFPSVWLVFLLEPVTTLAHLGGARTWTGIALVVVFAGCYLLALPAGWGGRRARFVGLFAVMAVITVAEIPLAHAAVFGLLVYLAVLLVAGLRRWALAGVAVLELVGIVLPVAAGWQTWGATSFQNAVTLPLVAMSMYGFFSLVDTNRALAAARTEVVRLAAENERTRIARDLHDLLGHSLTTVTVKAGLARKLAERDGSPAAAAELAEIEAVARRSLREVRAAVSGYTEVTLAGELATSRAVLRAAAIGADLPGAIDTVDPVRSELFGWVVREGVTNVVRHARARRCRIALGPTWIEITDDGHGVDTISPDRHAGHGLAGLRDRVEAAGGRLQAGTTAAGWRLRVDVPA